MSRVHPGINIGLGVIVLISSLIKPEMKVFIIAGIGFILWGIYGLITLKKNKEEEETKNKREQLIKERAKKQRLHNQQVHTNLNQNQNFNQQNRNFQQNNNNNNNNNNNQNIHNHNNHQRHNPQVQYKQCLNCRQVIEKSYRFCPYCGYGV